MRISLLMAALCSLALPSTAQVAPGEGLVTAIQGPAPGLTLFDVPGNGSLSHVTGIPPQADMFNSGVIDPVTGDVWLVGIDSTYYRVLRATLTGGVATSFVSIADLTSQPKSSTFPSGLNGIDFDRDGNVFVSDNSDVWRIDRSTGAVTSWVSGLAGEVNALTIDRVTNTLWTVELINGFSATPSGEIRSFDIDAGPSGGVVLLDLLTATLTSTSSAITYDGNGTLYVGTWDEVYSVDTTTGAYASLPITGSDNGFNSLDSDRVTGLLHTAGGLPGDYIYSTVDLQTFVSTEINNDLACVVFTVPGDPFCDSAGLNSALDVNDYLHTTQMFPRSASVSAGFKLEVSANGMPGDFAAIAVGSINGVALTTPFVLGSYGTCGLGGGFVFSSNVPGGTLPGFITSLGIGTATYDFATGVFSYGGVETLTLNP